MRSASATCVIALHVSKALWLQDRLQQWATYVQVYIQLGEKLPELDRIRVTRARQAGKPGCHWTSYSSPLAWCGPDGERQVCNREQIEVTAHNARVSTGHTMRAAVRTKSSARAGLVTWLCSCHHMCCSFLAGARVLALRAHVCSPGEQVTQNSSCDYGPGVRTY